MLNHFLYNECKDIQKNKFKSKIPYIVLTSLFGNYDTLKEPEEYDNYAKYICVTDRKDLTSNIWEFVYVNDFENNDLTGLQKSFIIKYKKLFDYFSICDVKYIVRLDASIQIHKSLYDIIRFMENNKNNCCLMLHPECSNMIDEYNRWETLRNHDKKYKDIFINEMINNQFNFNYNTGLIETTFQIYKKDTLIRIMISELSNLLERTTNFSDNNDQCYYTYILSKYINYINPLFVNRQIISSDYMDLCYHYTNNIVYKDHNHARGPLGEFIYDLDKSITYKLFNKEYKIKYF